MPKQRKAAATRVTITEQAAWRFFRAGSTSQASYDPDRMRVPVAYRWINLPPTMGGGSNKLIDMTGHTFNGVHWACEVKQHDISTDQKWYWDQALNDRQKEYLAASAKCGALAWVWIGYVLGKEPIASFLIPWQRFEALRHVIVKSKAQEPAVPWKSWTYQQLDAHAGDCKLTPLRLSWGTRKAWTWWTPLEIRRWEGYDKERDHPKHPVALPIEGLYL